MLKTTREPLVQVATYLPTVHQSLTKISKYI